MDILRIVIQSQDLHNDEIIKILEDLQDWDQYSIDLRLEKKKHSFRFIDSTILVAIVGVAGGAITALLTGSMKIAENKRQGSVTIKGTSNGEQIELVVPVDCSQKRLEEIVEVWKDLQSPRIEI